MITEKSCGAVVFTEKDGERLYLIEKMKKGHTSICKGHVESYETEHDTARREIFEETSLEITFVEGFRRTITYSPYDGCMKDVVFFLARAGSTKTAAQPEEVEAISWLPYGEALAELTHESDRQTLTAAEEFLNSPPAFRPMRREKRLMDGEKALKTLKNASSGVLSLLGDDGYPYGVPLSFVYYDGSIFFHGANTGHKLDAVRGCDKASFCVVARDDVVPEKYTTRYRSVIAFGRVREVTGETERRKAVDLLARKYFPEDSRKHREKFIDAEYDEMTMLELRIEHLTGKENR